MIFVRLLDVLIVLFFCAIVFSYVFGGFGLDIGGVTIFQINNIPEEGLEMVLAITCPNILFPYAREAVSDMVTKSGFQPVLLNPINFENLYLQQKQQQAQEQNKND